LNIFVKEEVYGTYTHAYVVQNTYVSMNTFNN
jgi:hypothetical protein